MVKNFYNFPVVIGNIIQWHWWYWVIIIQNLTTGETLSDSYVSFFANRFLTIWIWASLFVVFEDECWQLIDLSLQGGVSGVTKVLIFHLKTTFRLILLTFCYGDERDHMWTQKKPLAQNLFKRWGPDVEIFHFATLTVRINRAVNVHYQTNICPLMKCILYTVKGKLDNPFILWQDALILQPILP